MLDNHYVPKGYGIITNFTFGNLKISTYSFFVLLGLLVGLAWFYFSITRNAKIKSGYSYLIVMSALIGGLVGSKILVFFENFSILIKHPENFKYFLFTGKSIVGGLVGGYIGIRVIKKIKNIENFRCGNDIAPAVALGMAIGRIGCFLTGCCYGIKTNLLVGIDFGDGVNRIPTQLIEILFCFILFIYFLYKQRHDKNLIPGILFKQLVLYYFTFRFFIEFIRDTNKNILFLSIYQVICLIGIVFMYIQIKRSREHGK